MLRELARAGLGLIGCMAGLSGSAAAQAVDSSGRDLSTLDIDELARIRVTSVARRPEAVAQASAAVAVVTREDIRRAGVADLPEALRLLPGLAAARVGTRDLAVSARGFNALSKPFDLKELVRTVREVLDSARVAR